MENKLYDIFKKLFSWVKNASRQQASKEGPFSERQNFVEFLFFSLSRAVDVINNIFGGIIRFLKY